MNKPQTLGKRIAQARRELGVREHRDVTQLDLAKAVGVSGPTVSDWEADKKAPREATLARLAHYLGVTPAFLRYGVKNSPPGEAGHVPERGTLSPEEVAAAVARDRSRSGARAVPTRRTGQR